jgi:hypothetical protein
MIFKVTEMCEVEGKKLKVTMESLVEDKGSVRMMAEFEDSPEDSIEDSHEFRVILASGFETWKPFMDSANVERDEALYPCSSTVSVAIDDSFSLLRAFLSMRHHAVVRFQHSEDFKVAYVTGRSKLAA